jgi:hypothetical protein
MWVAIDCRSKNWVAVLKSLGSTVLDGRVILRGILEKQGVNRMHLVHDWNKWH